MRNVGSSSGYVLIVTRSSLRIVLVWIGAVIAIVAWYCRIGSFCAGRGQLLDLMLLVISGSVDVAVTDARHLVCMPFDLRVSFLAADLRSCFVCIVASTSCFSNAVICSGFFLYGTPLCVLGTPLCVRIFFISSGCFPVVILCCCLIANR